ncbi:MAG: N-acetylmuramoyl-L-alanine amidase family protein [bacterium]
MMIKWSKLALSGLLALILFGVSQSVVAQDPAAITNIRFGKDAQGQTRIVFDISQASAYRVSTRLGDDDQKLLAVEIDQASFAIGSSSEPTGTGNGIGFIGNYAYQRHQEGRAQILFELTDNAIPSSVFLIKPKGDIKYSRLVIDMVASSSRDFTKSLGRPYGSLMAAKEQTVDIASQKMDDRQAPYGLDEKQAQAMAHAAAIAAQTTNAPTSSDTYKMDPSYKIVSSSPLPRIKPAFSAVASKGPRLIVIDAGHGGRDPGATGTAGTKEKAVTLKAAKVLKTILQKRGYKVVLTRDKDQYIDLDKRLLKARDLKADLFLSIHADANSKSNLRGGSVYTLSDKGETRLVNQAKSKGDFELAGLDMSDVDISVHQTLFDLSTADSRRASSKFANMLIDHLEDKILMVNNTHREGNLVVLLAPDVPAVLLELAFMSNKNDEKNLNSISWHKKTMTAVADSIDAYFATTRGNGALYTANAAQ